MTYSRSDLSQHFNTTSETVRRWSRDFAQWLSATANDSNKAMYTDEDMRVLAYVQQAYASNHTTDNIIASVASGARGEFDGVLNNPTMQITEKQASEIWHIRQERDDLRVALVEAQKEIAVLQSKVEDIDSLREQINALNRQIGRLEARIEIMQDDTDG